MRGHGLDAAGNEFTSLFHAQPERRARRGFPAFALSTVVHGGGILAITYALLHAPVIRDPAASNYKVRHLDLHQPETAASRAAEALYPTAKKTPAAQPQKALAAKRVAAPSAKSAPAVHPVMALKLPQGGNGKQTLVQPDVKTPQQMAQAAPLPAVLIWTPALQQKLHLTPPTPDAVTTADAETSLELPNEELQLARIPERAADQPTVLQTPPAGNTTPVKLQQPSDVHMAPTTASTAAQQPTPAAVLSVSDLKMKDGTVVLPPVNELKGDESKVGTENPVQVLATHQAPSAPQGGTTVGDAQREAQGSEVNGESAEHIQLPRDGRFGVVVVGTSLSDQYPETLQIWSDRVAYTAYLHVGTPKAWILQYSLLQSAQVAAGGMVAHLEAPWPYDIVRPNLLSKDLNADALMIHGVLDATGRLVNLAVAYPNAYAHASFVLRELGKWQFRPAQERGKATPVEVLLIIPQEED